MNKFRWNALEGLAFPLSDTDLAKAVAERCSDGSDIEVNHSHADDLIIAQLKALGYAAACEAWDKVDKWYA